MISWQQIYKGTHNYRQGVVSIAQGFTGNVLSVKVGTKPEYENNNQIIGWLYQYSGLAKKRFLLLSGNEVICLAIPETDSLEFIPTPYLNELFDLEINVANINVSNSDNVSGSIPIELLALPDTVTSLQAFTNALNANIAALSTRLDNYAPAWAAISGKPSSFSPSTHAHEITDVIGLTNALNGKANSAHSHSIGDVSGLQTVITGLQSTDTTNYQAIVSLQSSDSSQNSSIASLQSAVATNATGISANSSNISTLQASVSTLQSNSSNASSNYLSISTNQVLASNKKYLATVAGLICTLPSNPSIGDVISLSAGNYTFRVNHGNASQQILNLSTSSTMGVNNGIILKAYADIDLIFVGGNLWKSGYRNRTINNNLGTQSLIANLPFSSNGDTNGLFYYLGTSGLTTGFENPVLSGAVVGLSSSVLPSDTTRTVDKLTNRSTASEFCSDNLSNSWAGFDIGANRAININRYMMTSRSLGTDRYLKTWVLEGANTVSANTVSGFNAATWTAIDSQTNNNWATNINVSANFVVSNSDSYRYIRLRQTGVNSGTGDLYMVLGELEVYGSLFTPSGEVIAI